MDCHFILIDQPKFFEYYNELSYLHFQAALIPTSYKLWLPLIL